MNEIEIKTRLGYIIQGIVRVSLERVDISFAENFSYEETCQVPDFLIPSSENPAFVVEVHQTDSRDSFRMKTLRSFTAITEAKGFYGEAITSVNVLFGDPYNELPLSNIQALFGFFDANIIPRDEANNQAAIINLENSALELASEEEWEIAEAIQHLSLTQAAGIESLSALLQSIVDHPQINEAVLPLWELEIERISHLGNSPEPKENTFYKRNILKGLYLTDEHFSEILQNPTPNSCTHNCSEALKGQLILTELAKGSPSLTGLVVTSIDEQFYNFLTDPSAEHLRNLGSLRLDIDPAMRYFFADLRDPVRRLQMAQVSWDLINDGIDAVAEAIQQSLQTNILFDIEHRCCWIADLAARYLGVSHNEMNRRLTTNHYDPQNLGNPFNQISYKSDRFMANGNTHGTYIEGFSVCFSQLLNDEASNLASSPQELANRLLKLRLSGAIKLQKLNPLYLVSEGVFQSLGLSYSYRSTNSILADFAGSNSAVAKHKLYHVEYGGQTALVCPIAAHDNNGDHKSKEWGARRLSTLYRVIGGNIQNSGYENGIFVLDGEWSQKDVSRLYRSGWNYIVRLAELEGILQEIFGF